MDRQDLIVSTIENCKKAAEGMDDDVKKLVDDMLKQFMPRVLTLEEVLNWKDCVWVEEKNGDTYVALIKRIWPDRKLIGVIDHSHYYVSSGCEYADYGRLKRYWTARPTKEQQENTKWIEREEEVQE